MEQFLQQVVNGLSIGSIYALIALGYTMVYGIIQLINFAHGDVYMVGAYVGYASMSFLGLDFFTSLLVAMAACTVLGVIIERVAYKPLRNSTRIAVLITAIGVSLLLEYTMMYFVGPEHRAYPALPGFMSHTFHFGEGNGIVSRDRRNIRTFEGSLEGHFIFRHHIGSVVYQCHSQPIFGNGSDCFQPIAICRSCLDCQYRLIGYFVV